MTRFTPYQKYLKKVRNKERKEKRALELYNFINLIQGIIKEGNKERSKENNINTNNINKEQE
jgi:hypothetical protein